MISAERKERGEKEIQIQGDRDTQTQKPRQGHKDTERGKERDEFLERGDTDENPTPAHFGDRMKIPNYM